MDLAAAAAFISESFGPRVIPADKEGRQAGRQAVIKSFLCVDHKVQKPFTSARGPHFSGGAVFCFQ